MELAREELLLSGPRPSLEDREGDEWDPFSLGLGMV